MELISFYFHSA